MLGADIEEEGKIESAKKISSPQEQFKGSEGLFKDPKAYRHLSKEQRERLTQEMMAQHRQLVRKLPGMGRG